MEGMICLSVIIPTRNRSSLLFNTLKSILHQTYDQNLFEVIVCDNNSSDNTYEVSHSFSDKFLHFRYIKTMEPGLHVGRNKGFQEAKGEILVYADDDIEAFPEWLETINEVFIDEKVVLVGGKNLPKWEVDPPDWVLEMLKPNENGERISGSFSIIDLGNQIKETNPYNVFGCNFSVRKKIISETKGFHPDGMPQEIIEYRGDGESAVSRYIMEKGYKTVYHPCASIYHLVSKERMTINYLRKRGFNQGVSDSYTSIRNATPASPMKAISFKLILKKLLHRMLKFFENLPSGRDNEVNIYYVALAEGSKDGFVFHQQKVKESSELKAWVMKDNYL